MGRIGMHERARQLLRQLVSAPDALSRNRHFSLFEEPRAARLRKRAAHLRQIRDVLVDNEARIERTHWRNHQMLLRMKYAAGPTQRTWLEVDEVAILKDAILARADARLRDEIGDW